MIYDKKFLRLTAIIIGLIIVIFTIFVVFRKSDSITIKGYDDKVHNLTDVQRDFMFKSLYSTVNINMPKGESPKVSDAVIRDGSNFETFNSATDTHEGTFIVDIPSIQQSYRVEYLNSKDEGQNKRGDVFVSCVSDDRLIYGDFDCIDMFIEQSSVPLQDRLPYVDISGPFKIVYSGKGDDGEDRLAITNSTPQGRESALKWLRSKDVDPTDIVIDYFGYDNPFAKFNRDF